MSQERQSVRVDVFDASDGWEGTLPEFIAWLSKKLEGVPAEFRADVQVELEQNGDHYDGWSQVSFLAWYSRPETDAEMAARIKRQAQEYAALKRKYEGA